MARGVEWGVSGSGRCGHRSELLFQQFEVLKHGARQLVGIVDACICEVSYFGRNDLGGEVIWLPKAKRSAHPLECRLHGLGDLWTEISGVHCWLRIKAALLKDNLFRARGAHQHPVVTIRDWTA